MQIKRLPYEVFKDIYTRVPRLTVEVIIKTPEGVILTKRGIEPYKDIWHIPGGTVLFGENVEEAVKRVAKEEVGLDVGIIKSLGYIEYDERIERGFGWTVGLAFLVYVEGGKITKNDESADIGVFKELPKDIIAEQREFFINSGIFA